jgi:hypothetical protein
VEKPQYYDEAIRVIASNHVYFPTNTVYNITCLSNMCYYMDSDSEFRITTRPATNEFFDQKYFFKRTHLSDGETVASIFTDDPANHKVAKRSSKNETNINDPLTR